ncbi:MAG: lipoate--protein ligase [Marinilabiliales bacterium]|nr:MAG: lipoate--protein ligase [Marinilabiliales bacterium]
MKYLEFDNHLRSSHAFAVEEYIMKNPKFEDEYFMFWRTKPTLMIGRFQNTIQEINSQFAKDNDIDVVRRNSGGGTVYTDPDCWQFSFITWKNSGQVKDFRDFTKPVIAALQSMGVPAVFHGRNDLHCEGKKFSGNAQFGLKNRFLHHGTILFDTNLENLVRSLNVTDEKIISKGIQSVRERVTNIRPFLTNDLESLEFRNKMIEILKGDMVQIVLSDTDLAEIEKIEKEKFLTWDWNYGNSPKFNITKSNRFDGGKVEVQLDVKNGIIETCSIYGDFFCNGDISVIQDAVVVCKYESSAIKTALQSVNAEEMLYLIKIDELVSCFVD